jgi:hypothetical protein
MMPEPNPSESGIHFDICNEVGKAVKGGEEAVKVLKTFKIGNLAD